MVANGHSKPCGLLARPPLKGESHLTQTSLPSIYNLKEFVCAWDVPAGVYWWYSPLKKGGVNPIYGGRTGNATSEVGQGWWLTPPTYFDVSANKWSSHAFVATRVESFNHTSCCCQVMNADLDLKMFRLTEYCRAVVVGMQMSPRDTCAPYADPPCPVDNATALHQDWPMAPYSESYSACLDPLGTTLSKPGWLKRENLAQQLPAAEAVWLPGLCLVSAVLSFSGLLVAVLRIRQPLPEEHTTGVYQVLPREDESELVTD
eukprot:TRINITY_DN51729_c0_g1_i1.p1 TRINITY_DN51729_c0_g1~~TRINITY_DN51729_c0_g1_i1.p1  ORF type:complete len:290 (+),score=16.26 TRINITY_DN51729_c0_g1_i1:92-871(+)